MNDPSNAEVWTWLYQSGAIIKAEARLNGIDVMSAEREVQSKKPKSGRGPGRPKGSKNKVKKNTGERREVMK